MRTRSIAWSELKLGIVGVVALIMVVMLVLAVGGHGGFFWQRYPLRAQFDDVHGLKSGAIVRLNGMEVGKVTDIRLAGARVDVGISVAKRVRHLITTESTASIGSISVLGEPIIEIKGSETGEPLPNGASVHADQSGGVHGLASTVSRSVTEATGLLTDLRAGEGTVGRLMKDEDLYRKTEELVTGANRVSRSLSEGKGTLGALLRDDAAYHTLSATLSDLHAITNRVNSGHGSLGRVIADDSLSRSLTAVVANLEQLTDRLARGDGSAGQFLNDDSMYARVDSLLARVDQLITSLEDGQGSAGRLLRDEQLYENVDAAATELRRLLTDVRNDPRRYLQVRVRLF